MTASTSFGSDCVVVRNNSTNKISIVELTKVQIKCTLWFVEPFDLPQSPLLATGAQTAYDISNPSLPPFTMAFRQNVMSFNDFKNAVVAEISTFAPGNLLRDALNTAASLGRVQWHYSIKEADGSRKWSAEAHLADKYPEFIAATRTFPYNANVSVHLKMDKPKGDEVRLTPFFCLTVTLVIDMACFTFYQDWNCRRSSSWTSAWPRAGYRLHPPTIFQFM
jgi:hypothetical protein